MQGISSYVSCMKLINVIIISKIGFKEFFLFKSFIFAWNSSSTQQLVCPYWQPLVLCSTAFELWRFLLVHCWIRFPMPIHMLHSDLRCENHTTSNMMVFIKFRQNIQLYFGSEMLTLAFYNFFSLSALKSCWEFHWIHWNCWKIHFEKLKIPVPLVGSLSN